MEFSFVLKQLRDERGLSQKDIAEHLGITRQAVAFYELGKREPDYQILRRLADYFGVSIDYLLGRVHCKEMNAVTIGKNIDLIREGMSFKEFSQDISTKTGTLIYPELLELYCKGEKVPYIGTMKILARYAGIRESFFYIHNTIEGYQKEKELCRREYELAAVQSIRTTTPEAEIADLQIKQWALQDENIEYIKLAKEIKEAELKPSVLIPLIESVKNSRKV
ncbi:MAG: helix-turn-helix domain-containing protein [Clostridia bacterium]|nr:helix-turn-helix domain-containing protein [Clostridia bacterium]